MWDNTFEIMSQTIMDFYRVILGQNIFNKEPFVKVNDPNVDTPMLITSSNPIVIRTCTENSKYWCQFYYQFGHEVTHYIFRQFKHDKNRILKWFEETACEAMALYIMKYISDDWPKNPLYNINKNYSNSILDYINNQLKNMGTNKLHICNDIETLTEIEITSEECREDRYCERNFLYNLGIV
jgi:hypothetical protein